VKHGVGPGERGQRRLRLKRGAGTSCILDMANDGPTSKNYRGELCREWQLSADCVEKLSKK
jgi:hypothetical protein